MDYEIEITFAPILCKIDVNAGENGSVTADKSEVNYGESTNITITANKGYCIDEVKVNGEDKKTSVTRSGENTYKLSIEILQVNQTKYQFHLKSILKWNPATTSGTRMTLFDHQVTEHLCLIKMLQLFLVRKRTALN